MNDLINFERNKPMLDPQVSSAIAEYERTIDYLKGKVDAIKKTILEEMEKNGIIKIETDDVVITYIASTERETFDSKTFRKDHSDLYDDYIKMSPVKASIKIKVKGD